MIRDELTALADPAYRTFQAPLVPTVDPRRILGVRLPALRRYARTLVRTRQDEARAFLAAPLPHETYDEMNLHGMLVGLVARTPEEAFGLLDRFLPQVDNWATCDLVRVPAFGRDLPATLTRLKTWATTGGAGTEYVVRFAVTQLMELFLGEAFDPTQLELVASLRRPEYYVNMARAWYVAEALVKQPTATLALLERRPLALDAWTHNKALQKARESRRVPSELKAHLRALAVPTPPTTRRGG